MDKLDYCSNLRNLKRVAAYSSFKFIKGDICSADMMHHVLHTEQIDTVLHFAAQTHVDNSFGNSFEFTKNNICGTHVLLETVKTLGTIKRFLHVSTDEVYGAIGPLPTRQQRRRRASTSPPYALTPCRSASRTTRSTSETRSTCRDRCTIAPRSDA